MRILTLSLAVLAVVSGGAPACDRDTVLSREELIHEFHNRWSTDPETWQKNKFLGIQTWQNPLDAWVTLEIISEVKPDVIVETGTYKGGSALLWAMYLQQVTPGGRVITIDIGNNSPRARAHPLGQQHVDFLIGSSTGPAIVEKVRQAIEGKRALFIFDSNHHRDHVLDELNAYAEMVPVGSYIVVQDSAIGGHPIMLDQYPGPYEAIEIFLADRDDFVPDRSRERLWITMNPMGFLKRVE